MTIHTNAHFDSNQKVLFFPPFVQTPLEVCAGGGPPRGELLHVHPGVSSVRPRDLHCV